MQNTQVERLTMTIEEAAQAVGISRGTAYALARKGILPAIRLGEKRLVVPVKKLRELLERNTIKPAASSS